MYNLIDVKELRLKNGRLNIDVFEVEDTLPGSGDLKSIKRMYEEVLGIEPLPHAYYWVIIRDSVNQGFIASISLRNLSASSMPLIFARYPKSREFCLDALKGIGVDMDTAGEGGTMSVVHKDFDECCDISALLLYRVAKLLKDKMGCDNVVSVTHVGVRRIFDRLMLKYEYLPKRSGFGISDENIKQRMMEELGASESQAVSWLNNYVNKRYLNIKSVAMNVDDMIETLEGHPVLRNKAF